MCIWNKTPCSFLTLNMRQRATYLRRLQGSPCTVTSKYVNHRQREPDRLGVTFASNPKQLPPDAFGLVSVSGPHERKSLPTTSRTVHLAAPTRRTGAQRLCCPYHSTALQPKRMTRHNENNVSRPNQPLPQLWTSKAHRQVLPAAIRFLQLVPIHLADQPRPVERMWQQSFKYKFNVRTTVSPTTLSST